MGFSVCCLNTWSAMVTGTGIRLIFNVAAVPSSVAARALDSRSRPAGKCSDHGREFLVLLLERASWRCDKYSRLGHSLVGELKYRCGLSSCCSKDEFPLCSDDWGLIASSINNDLTPIQSNSRNPFPRFVSMRCRASAGSRGRK